ncbi:PepSY domain-containing protein [Nocardia sp. NPDC004654]|uniref:PepSY domain-containing protein n=1 Tax=Nocardia sp. NPDC004654 TaxID=3154776 RepID=UPI0033AF2BAC
MRQWRQIIAGAGVAVCALGLTGCGDNDSDTGATASPTTPTTPIATPATPTTQDSASQGSAETASISAAQRALRTAADAVPNGRAFDVEIETSNGKQVFDVKVASDGNEVKVLVDQLGEQVVAQSRSDEPSDDVAKVESATFDAGRALEAAAEREPGAKLVEMELDTNRDELLIWQIELVRANGSEVEVDVDARTGAVVSIGQG